MRKINIEELMISDRDLDENTYETHREVAHSLRQVCEREDKGISVSALNEFQVYKGTVKEFCTTVGIELQAAVRENRAYDFGVVKNDDVIRWADAAKAEPVADILKDGKPVVFIATHPEEVPYAESTSVYLLSPEPGRSATLTEFMYLKKPQSFMIYASMSAPQPLGTSREVNVIAWSETPTPDTVNSTMNPCLMGAAFIREAAKGKVS